MYRITMVGLESQLSSGLTAPVCVVFSDYGSHQSHAEPLEHDRLRSSREQQACFMQINQYKNCPPQTAPLSAGQITPAAATSPQSVKCWDTTGWQVVWVLNRMD